MADEKLTRLLRQYNEGSNIQNFIALTRELDRQNSPYVEPVGDGKRQKWFTSPLINFNFEDSSPSSGSIIEAWDYAYYRDGVLPSLAQAVAKRFVIDKEDCRGELSNVCLKNPVGEYTRTIRLTYKQGERIFSAYTELPDNKESRNLLLRWNEGSEGGDNRFYISNQNPLICSLLEQANIEGRFCSLKRDIDTELEVNREEFSEYCLDPKVIALYGNSFRAQINAHYLTNSGVSQGTIRDIATFQIDRSVKELLNKNVIFRPVILCGEIYKDYVDVIGYFNEAQSSPVSKK